MIVIFGTFPPPIHGMSSINEKLYNQLIASGLEVRKINTSPVTIKRSTIALISRWIPLIRGWLFICRNAKKEDTLYLAPSAGWGQLYDIITLLITKLKGIHKIFIHHHSFKYLDQVNFVNRFFFTLTKNAATHIVLCEGMAKKLQLAYPENHTFILSNSSLLFRNIANSISKIKKQKGEFKIGYLSNITKDKGGWTIIKLAEKIQENNIPATVIIGGPCHDPELKNALHIAEQRRILSWRGPIYNEEKQEFLDSIDIFVFPTQYENEAEPLVVWEAIYNKIPVISYDRGCISAQIQKAGLVIDKNDDFVSSCAQTLQSWLNEPIRYQVILRELYSQSAKAHEDAYLQWNNFIKMLR